MRGYLKSMIYANNPTIANLKTNIRNGNQTVLTNGSNDSQGIQKSSSKTPLFRFIDVFRTVISSPHRVYERELVVVNFFRYAISENLFVEHIKGVCQVPYELGLVLSGLQYGGSQVLVVQTRALYHLEYECSRNCITYLGKSPVRLGNSMCLL